MKKLIVLGAIAALLMAMAAPAAAIKRSEEIGYVNYAFAANNNTRATFALIGNVTLGLFGGTQAFSNARYLGMYTVNSSFAGGNGTEANAYIFGGVATDSTAQNNVNTGFNYLGTNASAVACGRYNNATDTITGDCNSVGGKNGTSATARAKRNLLSTDFNGLDSPAKLMARDLTAMVRGLMTAYITVQRGQVAVLDNAQEVVS
ncbi:MAG: hypothetical protein QXT68_08045 [Halobacteria archaeon]